MAAIERFAQSAGEQQSIMEALGPLKILLEDVTAFMHQFHRQAETSRDGFLGKASQIHEQHVRVLQR